MRLRWSCSGSAAHLRKVHTSLATWLIVAGVPVATKSQTIIAKHLTLTANLGLRWEEGRDTVAQRCFQGFCLHPNPIYTFNVQLLQPSCPLKVHLHVKNMRMFAPNVQRTLPAFTKGSRIPDEGFVYLVRHKSWLEPVHRGLDLLTPAWKLDSLNLLILLTFQKYFEMITVLVTQLSHKRTCITIEMQFLL